MGTTGKGSGATASAAAREELAQELKQLRSLVREVGEQFILRREGEIEAIISNLAAIPSRKLKSLVPDLLHDIHSLRLKPAKGRMKDLKEIERMIEGLADRIISTQDEPTRSG